MSESKEEPFNVQSALTKLARSLLGRDALLMALVIVCSGSFVLYASNAMAQNVSKEVDAGIGPVAVEVSILKRDLDTHIKEEAEFKRYVMQYLDELATDNRAMYRTLQTGQRQQRLERPLESPMPSDGGR